MSQDQKTGGIAVAEPPQQSSEVPVATPEEVRAQRRGQDAIEDAATAPRGADGKPEVAPETELNALDYLLRPPKQLAWGVPVKIDTEAGEADLRFIIKSLPGRMLRDIERRSSKDGSLGPLAELDDQRIAAETVAAALIRIEDPTSGRRLDPRSEAFMQNAKGERIIDPADAISARFEFQSGIIMNLASEVRRISGWSADRVGTAQRIMVDAVGSSSNDAD